MKACHVPQGYPNGAPLFWMNEVSGVLKDAIKAFLNRESACDAEQFRLVKEYVAHWINAPGFLWDPEWTPRRALIDTLDVAGDRDAVWRVVDKLLDVGIDPF